MMQLSLSLEARWRLAQIVGATPCANLSQLATSHSLFKKLRLTEDETSTISLVILNSPEGQKVTWDAEKAKATNPIELKVDESGRLSKILNACVKGEGVVKIVAADGEWLIPVLSGLDVEVN